MGRSVKVEYDMEELFVGIKEAVKEELRPEIANEIKAEIKADITSQVVEQLKEMVPVKVEDWLVEILRDIYENTTVKVGGGWDKEPEEHTIKQFVTKEIKDSLGEGKVRIKTKDRYGDYETQEIAFTDWVTKECVSPEIKKYFAEQMKITKNEINKKVKEVFDESTRSMLSENVMSILMANDTYKKIQGNIASIASK